MITILLMGLVETLANPGDNAITRQDQVVAYLKNKAAEVTANTFADVDSLDKWKAIRPQKRREYLYMLGLDPMPERTPLNAKVTGLTQTQDYRIEKVVFESSPKLYVTGNFYLPTEGTKPLPTILYVCGHSPHPLAPSTITRIGRSGL